MFQRILFATDGTRASIRAAEALVGLIAHRQDASVTLVAAVSPRPAPAAENRARKQSDPVAEAREEAKRALRATAEVFVAWGIPHNRRLVEGDCACAAITRAAQQDLADVIVMGSREKAFTENMDATINVTDEVMQRATVPVMVLSPAIPKTH